MHNAKCTMAFGKKDAKLSKSKPIGTPHDDDDDDNNNNNNNNTRKGTCHLQ